MLCLKTGPTSGASIKSLTSCARLLLTAFLLTSATAVLAVQEIDPNNTCALAQNVGALSENATITVTGALKTPPAVPDIDFYKFNASTPEDIFRVSLHGVSDGVDTLTLPLAVVFNSSCLFPTFISGAYDPISFDVVVPGDGVVILAVTSCCDFGFTGAGFYAGSYTLTATEIAPVKSISGRAVDSVTAQPIAGVQATLTICQDSACTVQGPATAYSSTDPLGQFIFTSSFGGPFEPGTYQVTLQDTSFGRYETVQSPPFTAASGEQKVIADISMVLVPVIGSISGRIVDSVTHAPLSGVSAPYAHLQLIGCFIVCRYLSGYTDSAGRFRFVQDQAGHGIPANTAFDLFVAADQYQQLYSTIVTGGAGVNQDLGDVLVVSNPIRFSVLQGCTSVPLTGGVCEYKVEITNGIATPVQGEAWATINANGLGSFVGNSVFQTGEPQEMYLAGATRTTWASRTASFEFEIPGTVPTYSFICPTFWFGTGDDNAQLYTQGVLNDFAYCVQRTATGYTPATDDQIERLRKEAHEHEAKERAVVLPK